MLIELRIRNCFSFDDEVAFSMKADMRSKKFAYNVCNCGNFNILKSAGIYGPNNSGKTCLIKCIKAIRNILLHEQFVLQANMFSKSALCRLGVTFIEEGRKFNYDIEYDVNLNEYVYERFTEVFKDEYGNEREEVWLLKDYLRNEFICDNKDLKSMAEMISRNNLLMYQLDVKKFPKLDRIKSLVTRFASKIEVVDMNKLPLKNTIDIMKNENNLQSKIVDFIKNADLYMDDFKYVNSDLSAYSKYLDDLNGKDIPQNYKNQVIEELRLVSVYKGVEVSSVLFDSVGTQKIVALASYVINALEKGSILVVDELDSSIHFKLTRAIVAMFNNELNKNGQLIFTVHDINLMDCKKLLRKEQIWFVHKDRQRVYLYSLSEFTAQQGVRDTTDIIEKYRKGALGALPDPDLINSLIKINGNGGVPDDEE